MLEKFARGPVELVRKLNLMVDVLNMFLRGSGGGYIQVKKTGSAITYDLNVDKLLERIPKVAETHLAYAKDDAGAGTTLDCYLDTDTTGTEVTVNFSIIGGTNLNAALPRLSDGDLIFVENIKGSWYCKNLFADAEECDCYSAP